MVAKRALPVGRPAVIFPDAILVIILHVANFQNDTVIFIIASVNTE